MGGMRRGAAAQGGSARGAGAAAQGAGAAAQGAGAVQDAGCGTPGGGAGRGGAGRGRGAGRGVRERWGGGAKRRKCRRGHQQTGTQGRKKAREIIPGPFGHYTCGL